MKERQPHERKLRVIDTGADRGEGERLLDQDAPARLRNDIGEAAFSEVLEDAIFEITERLAAFETAARVDDNAAAAEIADRLSVIARSIGFTAVATVAEIAASCCRDDDPVAARAVASRLMRVGEDSLTRAALNNVHKRR